MKYLITFPAGTYGTYLNYIVAGLVDPDVYNRSPFGGPAGNSHWFDKQKFKVFDTEKICNAGPGFYRGHPSDLNFKEVEPCVDGFIHILYQQDLMLLVLNNRNTKISPNNSFVDRFLSMYIRKICDTWELPYETDIADIDRWIVREFLSTNIIPMQVNNVRNKRHPKLKNEMYVELEDLLYSPFKVIDRIADFCSLPKDYPKDKIQAIHEDMMGLQQHLSKDHVCQCIVRGTINGANFNFPELTVLDEAWLQWKFKTSGFELVGFNLNTFPTNTADLKKLLHPL